MEYSINIIVLMKGKGTRFIRKIVIGKRGENIPLKNGLKKIIED